MATIEDLLKSMLTLNDKENKNERFLNNSADTWSRIGAGDSFSELNFSSDQEKKDFLADWMSNNPYTSI